MINSVQEGSPCPHPYIIGDTFIQNCKLCGIFFPKSGSQALRSPRRNFECDFFISDFLREAYQNSLKKQQLVVPKHYCQERNALVDWLSEVSDQLQLQNKTLHQAVMILDMYMASQKQESPSTSGNESRLQALGCMFISAKSYENDSKIPKSSQFMQFLPNQLGECPGYVWSGASGRLIQIEKEILNAIGWNYEQCPNFYSILEIFHSQGIVYSYDSVYCTSLRMNVPLEEKNINLVEKYTEFFSLMCLQDPSFINLNPYLAACAIVTAARKKCGVVPTWSTELAQLAGLNHSHFSYVEDIIFSSFESTFKPSRSKLNYSPDGLAGLSTAESPNLSPQIENFQRSKCRIPFRELQLNKITPDKLPQPLDQSQIHSHNNPLPLRLRKYNTNTGRQSITSFKQMPNGSSKGYQSKDYKVATFQVSDYPGKYETQENIQQQQPRPQLPVNPSMKSLYYQKQQVGRYKQGSLDQPGINNGYRPIRSALGGSSVPPAPVSGHSTYRPQYSVNL